MADDTIPSHVLSYLTDRQGGKSIFLVGKVVNGSKNGERKRLIWLLYLPTSGKLHH